MYRWSSVREVLVSLVSSIGILMYMVGNDVRFELINGVI